MKPNLDSIPLFADFSGADRQKLADSLHFVRFRQSERIFGRGEGPDALYIIENGWAKLLDADGLVVANVGPGNLLGESEVLTGSPRGLEAQAASDISLWGLDAADLDRMVAESLDLGLALNKMVGGRVAPFINYLVERRLKPIPFFFDLDYSDLAEVAEKLVLERYQRGSFLFHRGGWARALFIVESGEVSVIASEPAGRMDTVALRPGDVIGEVALLTGKPYSLTAEVGSEATVWALGREDFERICGQHPSVRLILSRSMFMTPRLSDKTVAMDYLRRIPMFAEVHDDALKAIAQRLILRHMPQNELVYAEGSPGEAMYIVDSGEVEVLSSADQVHDVLARLREGDYFGESALLTGRSRAAAVRAVTNTNVWALYRSDFDELMIRFPSIRQALSQTLSRELSGAGRRLTTIDGEVVIDSPGQADRMDATGRALRGASPLAASIGRVPDAGSPAVAQLPPASQPQQSTGRTEPSQRQKTQAVPPVKGGVDPLEREFVPSRPRDEFVRAAAVEGTAVATPKPADTGSRKTTSAAGGATAQRQTTVAQDAVVYRDRPNAPAAAKPSSDSGPLRMARWFTGLSLLGKMRLLALVLITIWLCGVTAPATLLWGVSSAAGPIKIGSLSTLLGGGQPDEPTAVPVEVAVPTEEPTLAPPPTDTPAPPTDTPAPTNTPVPSTNTPEPTDTPIPPSPTPDMGGEVSGEVAWLRDGPAPTFKAQARLGNGDKVSILGRDDTGDWLQVRLDDGTVGWLLAAGIETRVRTGTLAVADEPPTPTPRATQPPTETPPPAGTPTPADTPTPAIKYPAPTQLNPADGFQWTNGRMGKNYLEWEPLNIGPDEFYNVTLIYKRNGEDTYFGDSSTEPRYLLPEGLLGIADQNWFEWRVVVRKAESKTADGKPDGPAISPESGLRKFKWE